jgi:transcriptional regulator with XRE-family HTH domain
MARSGLGWSAKDLAAAAGIGYATVARFESGDNVAAESIDAMRAALVEAGAHFSHKTGRVGVTVPE